MGAVAWAIRQRSVSHPRSSNRTCPIKASGSPTGFTVRQTAGRLGVGVRDAADRVVHSQRRERTDVCHVLHFVPSGEEVAYALINVSVNDRSICNGEVRTSSRRDWAHVGQSPITAGIMLSLIHISEPTRPY